MLYADIILRYFLERLARILSVSFGFEESDMRLWRVWLFAGCLGIMRGSRCAGSTRRPECSVIE